MKKYPFLESLGSADGRFVEEVLEYNTAERRIFMKKKIIAIALAAAIAALCGMTAFAVGSGLKDMRGLVGMKGYVDSENDSHNVPDSLGDIDLESIGTSLVGEDDPAPEPGESRITGIVAGRSGYWVTFEVNVNDADFAESVADFGACEYDWEHIDAYGVSPLGIRSDFGGIICTPKLVSAEDGILMFAFNGTAFGGIPDEIAFSCKGFTLRDAAGGRSYKNDRGFEFSVKKSDCISAQTLTSKEQNEIGSVDFRMDIDCCGLFIYSDEEVLGSHSDLINHIFNDCPITFRLKDGTEITEPANAFGPESEGWEEYTSPENSRIISGRGTEEHGIYYCFASVYDVSQIESVEIDGAKFTF